MASGDDGVVTVSYRPLTTLDGLHTLLLAAAAAEPSDVALLGRIFSLPANVLAKEMAVLGSYGLVRTDGEVWTATSRGRRLAEVWDGFGCRCEIDVRAAARQWLLGPGEYSLDEMIRDLDEAEALARKFGVGDNASALAFLAERRNAAERLEAFMVSLSPRRDGGTKGGSRDEVSFFDHVGRAESDQALTRLRAALASHLDALIGVCREGHEAGADSDDHEGGLGRGERPIERSRRTLERFDKEARAQRSRNRHLAEVKRLCEGRLAGWWLLSALGLLSDAYRSEPAAFVFLSTVPHLKAETTRIRPPAPSPASPPAPGSPRRDEGLLRSLFRWLFG